MTLDIKNLNCVTRYRKSVIEDYLEEKIKKLTFCIRPKNRPYLEIDSDGYGNIIREWQFLYSPLKEITYTRWVGTTENLDILFNSLHNSKSTEYLTLKCGDKGDFGISFRLGRENIYDVAGIADNRYLGRQFLKWVYNTRFYPPKGVKKLKNNPTYTEVVEHIKTMTYKEAVKCVLHAGRIFSRFMQELKNGEI